MEVKQSSKEPQITLPQSDTSAMKNEFTDFEKISVFVTKKKQFFFAQNLRFGRDIEVLAAPVIKSEEGVRSAPKNISSQEI